MKCKKGRFYENYVKIWEEFWEKNEKWNILSIMGKIHILRDKKSANN